MRTKPFKLISNFVIIFVENAIIRPFIHIVSKMWGIKQYYNDKWRSSRNMVMDIRLADSWFAIMDLRFIASLQFSAVREEHMINILRETKVLRVFWTFEDSLFYMCSSLSSC